MAKRFAIYAAVACAAALAASGAVAEDYPVRPIRVLVGFSAGSVPTSPRASSGIAWVRSSASRSWSRTRPVGSSLAAEQVARAPKDGYTLLMATIANVINAVVTPISPSTFARTSHRSCGSPPRPTFSSCIRRWA